MTHEQFTQIYLPLSGKMYALAYNLLRNREEARDCVQDVYAELWNKRDTASVVLVDLHEVFTTQCHSLAYRICMPDLRANFPRKLSIPGLNSATVI